MAREVFYRKFRSQTFADIVGQEATTRTLCNAVRTGRLSHAYLFCGPRGVGKTSAARVLAKAVNCEHNQDGEPCNQCAPCRAISEGRCMDVLEVDAASNRGIEEIRNIRDGVGYAPTEVRMKFYILDEAHMLTPEACNAILKTLEEPPPHATFVLVTTEAHRLPATVLSRCQRFDFRRIPLKDVMARLRYVCEREDLHLDDVVLEYVGRLATGSLRDAESLLDQLVSYCGPEFSVEQIQAIMGTTGSRTALQLADFVLGGRAAEALRLVNQAVADGVDLRQFARSLVDTLRGVLMVKLTTEPIGLIEMTAEGRQELVRMAESASTQRLLDLVRIFGQADAGMRNAFPPQLPLELAVVEATLAMAAAPQVAAVGSSASQATGVAPQVPAVTPPAAQPTGAAPTSHAPQSPGVAPPVVATPIKKAEEPPKHDEMEALSGEGRKIADAAPADLLSLRQRWGEVVDIVGRSSASIQAVIRDCVPLEMEGDQVALGFRYEFHRKRLDDLTNRRLVEAALTEVMGRPIRVRSIAAPRQQHAGAGPSDDPIVKTALAMGARIRRVGSDEPDPSQP